MSVDVKFLSVGVGETTYPVGYTKSINIFNAGTADVRVNFDETSATDYTLIESGTSLTVDDWDVRTLYFTTGAGTATVYLTISQN